MNLLGKRFHPPGQLLWIDVVVAKACVVVVPFTKPAVVEDKQFYAKPLCLPGKAEKLTPGESKKTGFPVVDEHGALFVFPVSADDVPVHKIVKVCAHPVETIR
ncbi:hypothetical protein SDC9_205290 [bioreactor metagenome]|uniref:Uncharacterized protein n=1 Tax=bioreactor metagenome TaxID=1076179 RepID=A0A645J2C4_9ZZZZ